MARFEFKDAGDIVERLQFVEEPLQAFVVLRGGQVRRREQGKAADAEDVDPPHSVGDMGMSRMAR